MNAHMQMDKFSGVQVDEQGREFVVYLPTGVRYLLRKQNLPTMPPAAVRTKQEKKAHKQRKRLQSVFSFDVPTRFVLPSTTYRRPRAYYIEGSGHDLD